MHLDLFMSVFYIQHSTKKNPWSLRPADHGAWREVRWEQVEFPEELWLISPDRKYKFDLREYYDWFVVSERFLSLFALNGGSTFRLQGGIHS